MPRSSIRSRRRLIAAAITFALVAGIGGGAYVGYASLKQQTAQLQASLTADLQAGQRELEAAKASLQQANSKREVSLVAEASSHFAAAKGRFVGAAKRADSSRLLQDLETIPGVGSLVRSRHVAVDGIAGLGIAISDAGIELSALDGLLLTPTPSVPAGRTLLTVLEQAKPSLVKVRADLELAQEAALTVDVKVLPAGQQGTFLKARDTINSALTGLDEVERLVPVLVDVLGGNGVRTYLVEQVNPAELRPGGGFIGTYSVLRADRGVLKLVRSGDAYDLVNPRPLPGQKGFVPQPSPLRDVIPTVSWSFVDTNIFPDFPSSAVWAERFVKSRLGNVDGVISIDYYTVAKMLELTGPLAVPKYRRTMTSTTLIPQLIHLDLTGDPAHKAILAAIAGPLMARVLALPPGRWPELISAFNNLSAQRHIQAYFNNESVEKEIERVGWSGAFNPTSAQDHMMEVESNIGGGKTNYFLVRHYTVVLTRQGSQLHHKVTVDLLNTQPNSNRYVTYYTVYVSLYVGDSTSSGSSNLAPAKYPNPMPPIGTTLLEGWMPTIPCCGARASAVFEYDTRWPTQNGQSVEIYWQKQPGTLSDGPDTLSDRIDVIWNDGQGHTFTASGDLGVDRLITLTAIGVTVTAGHPAQATLPSLNLS